MPVSASRIPATPGPTRAPRFSIIVDATFDAVRSSGPSERVGRSADWAGQ
jgi:hypothetical protein